MRFVFRLVLIVICLLGIVLSVKCVDILVICFVFFVIIMKLMIIRIMNMMMLIVKLLLIRKWLNVLIIWLVVFGLVWFLSSMMCVDVMFSDRCSSVENSSMFGNVVKLSGFIVYMLMSSIIIDSVMLNVNSRFSSIGGSGRIIIFRIM